MKRVFSNTLIWMLMVAVYGTVMIASATTAAGDGFGSDDESLRFFEEHGHLDRGMLDLYDVMLPTVGWFRLTTDTGYTLTFRDASGIFQVLDQGKLSAASMPYLPDESLAYLPDVSSSPKQVFFSLFTEPDDEVADIGVYWDDPNQTTVSLFRLGFNAVHTGDRATIGAYQFSFEGGEMTVHRPYEDGFHASFSAPLTGLSAGPSDDDQPPLIRAYIVGEVCAPHPDDHPKALAFIIPNIEDTPCEVQEEKFRIVDTKPENRRENVDFNDPGIIVITSKAINAHTLPGNVSLVTMSASGDELVISGEARLVDRNAFEFIPDDPLLDLVVYEVRVKGGDDGVKSVDEDFLDQDYSWRFSTLLDLNWLDELSGGDEESSPVKIRVYQTVEDAPLLAGKPTLTRVWVQWSPHEHICDDWQPKYFRAHISAEDSHDGMVYTDYKDPFVIRRPDQFSDAHKRYALDSTNLFNWRPQQVTQSTEFIIEIEPHDVYPMLRDEHIYEQEKSVRRYPHDPKRLTFDYFFIRVGPWQDDIPAEQRSLARAMLRNSERYTTQLFPVISTSGRFAGDFVAARGREVIQEGQEQAYFRQVMRRLHSEYAHLSGTDVIVGLTPLESTGFGESYAPINPRDWVGTSWTTRTVMMPIWAEGIDSIILTHEIGHAYHLHHQPRANNREEVEAANKAWQNGRYPGIEGFLIAPGGTHGQHKSTKYGNAEHPDTLLSFMFPVSRPQNVAFIMNEEYDNLLMTMEVEALVRGAVQFEDSHLQPILVASANPASMVGAMDQSVATSKLSDTYRGSNEYVLVAGYIHKEEGAVSFSAVRRGLQLVREGPDGSFSAVALDDQGNALAQQSFGQYVIPALDDDDEAWMYFQVVLPEHADITSIEIKHGDEVLGTLMRPEEQPRVAFLESLSPPGRLGGDGRLTVAWDGGGENVLYTLMYSPDGNSRWQLLALDLADTTMTIDTRLLEPGENPTLRVIAGNLFDEAQDTMSIEIDNAMVPIWLTGGEGKPVGTLFDVEVTFDRDLDGDSLAGRFNLVDESGELVPSMYRYDEHARVAILTPAKRLTQGIYKAVLSSGVADRYGGVMADESTRVFVVQAEEHDELADHIPDFFDALPLTTADRVVDVAPMTPSDARQPRDARIHEWLYPSGEGQYGGISGNLTEPMDVDEYLGLWQDVATDFGIGDEMAGFLDFLGGSLDGADSLWDVVFDDVDMEDVEDIWGSPDDWFGGDVDWDEMQRELAEAEAMLESLQDRQVARPVEIGAGDVTAPGTGLLHMEGRRLAFEIESCVLPSLTSDEMNVVGRGIVEGTGQAFEISFSHIVTSLGADTMTTTSIGVETEDDMLMTSDFGMGDSEITFALTDDRVVHGEGSITSFTTFQKYQFVLTAHCR